jgi:PAS domain S-box-containing protein
MAVSHLRFTESGLQVCSGGSKGSPVFFHDTPSLVYRFDEPIPTVDQWSNLKHELAAYGTNFGPRATFSKQFAYLRYRFIACMKSITPEQLSTFFELSLDLLCVANMEGYFLHINPAWEKLLGYTAEELKSRPFVDFIHPDDVQATQGETERLDQGLRTLNFENRYRAKDGSWKWLSWRAVPYEDNTIFAVARDVTGQKEAELAMAQLLQRLERGNQELDKFAYIVSHDLKAPLRGITNLAEWIEEDLGENLPEEVKGHLQLLRSRVEWMQRLINDLLVYARLGRTEAKPEPLDVRKLLEEIVSTLNLPQGFQVKVVTTIPVLLAVRVEVYQLFLNLLANAVKYRISDDGWVEISCEESSDRVTFHVKDNGVGIAAEHHQRIFQVFQRLEASNEVEGTGIGLSIVKKIVEAAGGEISVASEKGKGTTFHFSLPKLNLHQ